MSNGWVYEFCAAFVVDPGVGLSNEEIVSCVKGSSIDVTDIPIEVLNPLFHKARNEYPIGFVFSPNVVEDDAVQENDVLDDMRAIATGTQQERLHAAEALALKLSTVTRQISGAGLLVFLVGNHDSAKRLVIWKFPQEETIQAQAEEQQILIRRIEDAFSTESTYVKAVFLEDEDPEIGFWTGRVEDRQSKDRLKEVADYWIEGFLNARPEATDAYGTRVLTKAIKSAIKRIKDHDEIMQLIASLISLRRREGQRISIGEFIEQAIPGNAGQVVIDSLDNPDLIDSVFRVTVDQIESVARLRKLDLDNGFSVSGPIQDFDEMVKIEELDDAGMIQIVVRGRLSSQKVIARR